MAVPSNAKLIKNVDADVKRLLEAEYDDPRSAFAHVAMQVLFDLDDDEAYEACEVGTVDGAGPHAFWHDEGGRRVVMLVASYSKGAAATYGSEVVDELDEAYSRTLSERVADRRDKLGSVARRLARLREEEPDYPIELLAACFGGFKRTVAPALKQANEDAAKAVDFKALPKTDMVARVRESESRDAPSMSDDVELTLHSYFPYEQKGQPKAIVANVDALQLAELEQAYGYRLFQANVRYLLQGSQKINDDIASTLESADDRENFWYYNNGIAIICDSYEWADKRHETLRISNFQIVNGCQTTATLARTVHALKAADPPIQILARIIAAGGTSDEDGLRESIPLYNNRQNAVVNRDLQSNDKVQRRLQLEFSKLAKPWFYQRKRGEWEAKGGAEKLKRYEGRRIENDIAAQAHYAFFHDPAVARARKRQLFARARHNGGLYEEIFNAKTTPESLLLPYKLATAIRPKITEYRREVRKIKADHRSALDQKKLDQEWLKFGEQYIIGVIGWYIRQHRRITPKLLRDLALERFDELFAAAYPAAVRDLTIIFRRVSQDQPVNEQGVKERVDYANYVKGHWPEMVALLNTEYDLIRDEMPLEDLLS